MEREVGDVWRGRMGVARRWSEEVMHGEEGDEEVEWKGCEVEGREDGK